MYLSRSLFIPLKSLNISSTVHQVSRVKLKNLQLIKRNFQTVKQNFVRRSSPTGTPSNSGLIFKYGLFTIGVNLILKSMK